VFKESSRHKIVGYGLSALVHVETKQDDSDDVVDVIRQIIKGTIIAIFARIQHLLSSSALADGGFLMSDIRRGIMNGIIALKRWTNNQIMGGLRFANAVGALTTTRPCRRGGRCSSS
jgi:hypothetical protein